MKQRLANLPLPVVMVLAARLLLLLGLPVEGITGYGDALFFFRSAAIPGLPYIHYWSEYGPAFAYLNKLLFLLAGGKEHVFVYLFSVLVLLADGINVWLLARLDRRLNPDENDGWRVWVYAMLLCVLLYSWSYLEPLVVLTLLLGLNWWLERKDMRAGAVIGLGVISKWFPLLLLPALWKAGPPRRALKVSVVVAVIALLVYGGLYALSPQFTRASLAINTSKGSWETVWALVDGNFQTGKLGELVERYDPAAAAQSDRNPALIPPWMTLIVFGGLGLWGLLRARADGERGLLALTGFTLSLFMLWSVGWSPQWVLYFIPLVLLTFPRRLALLMTLTLVAINLVEYPVLQSRGMESAQWAVIVFRTLLVVLLAVEWLRQARAARAAQP